MIDVEEIKTDCGWQGTATVEPGIECGSFLVKYGSHRS